MIPMQRRQDRARFRKNPQYHVYLPLISLLLAACSTTKPSLPEAQLAKLHSLRKVAILPPQVEVYSVAVGGAKEQLTQQELQVTNELIDSVRQQLADQGRDAQATGVGTKKADDAEQLFRDTWLRETYDRIAQGLHPAPPTTAAAFAADLGAEAKAVTQELGADGLILIRCHAEQRTRGSVAGEMATKLLVGIATAGMFMPPGDPAGTIVVDAALVDGGSGNVVWSNTAGDFKMAFMADSFDKSVLDGVVKKLFATLPKAI